MQRRKFLKSRKSISVTAERLRRNAEIAIGGRHVRAKLLNERLLHPSTEVVEGTSVDRYGITASPSYSDWEIGPLNEKDTTVAGIIYLDDIAQQPYWYSSPDSNDEFRSHVEYSFKSLIRNCSKDNWDGYGSSAVSEVAIGYARKLLANLLPELKCYMPNISVYEDGEILISWRVEKNILSVLVPAFGRIRYSSIIGTKRNTGSDVIGECRLPQDISNKLTELFSGTYASAA